MNRRKLQLVVSGIFLLGIIFAAFATPVQAQTTLCWEVSVVVGTSGTVRIRRFNEDFGIIGDNHIQQLTPGSTYTKVIPLTTDTGLWVTTWDEDGQNLKRVVITHDLWNWDGIFRGGGEWFTIRLLPYAEAEACYGGFRDGRINWEDVSVNAALYTYNGGLRVYLIDEATSEGWLAIDASRGDIVAARAEAVATGVNQLIGETEFGVSLWALSNGRQVQMNYSHFDGTPLIFIAGR